MSPRDCAACGTRFTPKAANQATCSPECRAAHLRAYHREWKRARRRPKPTVLPDRACLVCGKPYRPGRRNQAICGSESCRAERKRQANRMNDRRPAVNAGTLPMTCSECGRAFLGHYNAIACSPECLRDRKRRLKRTGRAWTCIACGRPFEARGSDRYTCSPACRRAAHARRFDRNRPPGYCARLVDRRRARKEADPAYRETLSGRDARQRARRALAAAALDLIKVADHADRIAAPEEG